jgi:hypothetical protein
MRDRKHEDLSGRRFGKRVVQWPVGRKNKSLMWLCLCDCGKVSVVDGRSLQSGYSTSCISCGLRCRPLRNRGSKNLPGYTMMTAAKCRAKKQNIPFDIELEDIFIPSVCPLLEIPLIRSNSWTANCPSLDRKIPSLGYVKGNIWVISGKANAMKNDSTIKEMELLLNNWKKSL